MFFREPWLFTFSHVTWLPVARGFAKRPCADTDTPLKRQHADGTLSNLAASVVSWDGPLSRVDAGLVFSINHGGKVIGLW